MSIDTCPDMRTDLASAYVQARVLTSQLLLEESIGRGIQHGMGRRAQRLAVAINTQAITTQAISA